ncbi:ComF family protein [Brevundimonas sp.]|uniref:ComF family protein n=1 Tax=Brevundimonas sp. TaxID=1871086 RepID=UPI002FC74EB0
MAGLNGGSRSGIKAPWAIRLRDYGRALVDIVLPPASLDGLEGSLGGLSALAFSRITFLEDPVCDGCGLAFEYELSAGGGRCISCQSTPFVFSRARAACIYDEHSRGLILGLKHGDQQAHAKLFARWLSRAADPLILECDAVVPVPLHPSRLLQRRFNQSAEIARPLAALRGLTYLPDSLKRIRPTQSQGGKSLGGRKTNVRGAFRVTTAGARQIQGRRILLVDDVLTTGATANACAKALLAAGAVRVDLAVIAGVRGARETPR